VIYSVTEEVIEMAWEIFTKESRQKTTAPMLTIGQKLGRITLNRSAAMLFDKEGPIEAVLLLWDKERRVFGIRPINRKDPRSFGVRYTRSKDKDKSITGAAFAGVAFLKYIGYDFSTTKAYPVKRSEDESMFEVEVPADRLSGSQQPLIAVEGGRKHGKAANGD
jgi:hypothetical protein